MRVETFKLTDSERRLLALTVAVAALETIASSDYRGNRPTECVTAEAALKRIDGLVGA